MTTPIGSSDGERAPLKSWPQLRDYNRALVALKAILADPYGCPFCDSGKLRNPAKPHDEDCGFALARAALSSDREMAPEAKADPSNEELQAAVEEAMCKANSVLRQLNAWVDAGIESGNWLPDAWGFPRAAASYKRSDPELGDRFMEILRAIHGPMPDDFADSARLAFVHAIKSIAALASSAHIAQR